MSKKIWPVVLLCLIMLSSNAFAWGWRKALPPRHNVIVLRGSRYHYWHGAFWRPGPVGYFKVRAPIGAVITILPSGYRTVIYAGVSYYVYDNVYYADTPSGYVVVPPPAENVVVQESTVVQSTTVPGESITVNVPNENGSFTEVKLVKYKKGYLGPQGEFYPGHPTVDQLRALYGK